MLLGVADEGVWDMSEVWKTLAVHIHTEQVWGFRWVGYTSPSPPSLLSTSAWMVIHTRIPAYIYKVTPCGTHKICWRFPRGSHGGSCGSWVFMSSPWDPQGPYVDAMRTHVATWRPHGDTMRRPTCGSDGTQWGLMGANGTPWVPIGFPWDLHGVQRGTHREPVEVYGLQWIPHGFHWVP